jgi:hypothetical protein
MIEQLKANLEKLKTLSIALKVLIQELEDETQD